jgi:hypothetical protein
MCEEGPGVRPKPREKQRERRFRVYNKAPGVRPWPGKRERERRPRVYNKSPGFDPAPHARETLPRVYKTAAPGCRPGPRGRR